MLSRHLKLSKKSKADKVKIDHLYAIKTIEETHAAGGKVLSFLSYCGGLPAAECSDNPLGYKARCSPLLYISLDPFFNF